MKRIIALMAVVATVIAANAEVADTGVVYNVNGVMMRMMPVPQGEFYAGAQTADSAGANYDPAAQADEAPVHKVTVNGFLMGETEVTQEFWMAVTGHKPKEQGWEKGYGKGPKFPAYYISMNEAYDFIEKLNDMLHESGQLADSLEFDLPSEAEWEYAARGGENNVYAGGADMNELGWSWENGSSKSHEVGGKKANGYGLKDMSGNVMEWTSDLYVEYAEGDSKNPAVKGYGDQFVVKGGSWMRQQKCSRVTARFKCNRDFEYVDYGFRLILRGLK